MGRQRRNSRSDEAQAIGDKAIHQGTHGEEASDAILPVFGIAGTVKNGDDGKDILLHEEEHLKWESPRQGPADTPVNHWVLKRIAQDGVQSRTGGREEICTEARDTAFVPVEGVRKFRFGFGPDD